MVDDRLVVVTSHDELPGGLFLISLDIHSEFSSFTYEMQMLCPTIESRLSQFVRSVLG